jgi:hypothetical protein
VVSGFREAGAHGHLPDPSNGRCRRAGQRSRADPAGCSGTDAWNATMLPLDPAGNSGGFNASELADHFGVSPDD